MIDIEFEQYSELSLTDFRVTSEDEVGPWIHLTVSFTSHNLPEGIEEPQALVILNQDGEVLQIVLQEEGCDSPNFQFTETEKTQISQWLSKR
ncbi:hypothetical protein [Bacillus alkalicellulosilyticus]|uniref:hypothetical protein n=1 Tax=Alkalihalobacterium alkalicellulosilyticum TaxID=1912214 RepID=UPI0009965715|nr:hypothetical protein [Bacillus alkalicellulosilyticus]